LATDRVSAIDPEAGTVRAYRIGLAVPTNLDFLIDPASAVPTDLALAVPTDLAFPIDLASAVPTDLLGIDPEAVIVPALADPIDPALVALQSLTGPFGRALQAGVGATTVGLVGTTPGTEVGIAAAGLSTFGHKSGSAAAPDGCGAETTHSSSTIRFG
jgi:hypothetical protein